MRVARNYGLYELYLLLIILAFGSAAFQCASSSSSSDKLFFIDIYTVLQSLIRRLSVCMLGYLVTN
jgi:hypothetical protein